MTVAAMTSATSRQRVSREAVLVAVGQAGSAIGALVGVRLLSHALAPAAYGELALAMTIVTFLQQTLVLPVQSASLRFFVPAQEMDAGSTYARAVRRLAFGSASISAAVVALFIAGLALTGHRDQVLLPGLSGVFTIVLGLGLTIDGIQNAARRRLVTAWHDSLSSWSRFLLGAGLVYLTGIHTSAVAMAGYCLGAVITLISQALVFPPRVPPGNAGSDAEFRRQMLKFAAPLSVFGLAFAVQMAAERWSLGVFATTAQVGQYSVLVQLGYYPLVTLSNFLVQLAAPLVFAEAGSATDMARRSRARRMTWRLLTMIVGITAVLAFGAWLTNGIIFRLLVAPEYRSVSWLLPFVVLNAGLLACGQMAALTLMTDTRTSAMVMPKLVSAVLTVVVCFVGAKRMGIAGVVVGGVIPAFTYFAWVLVLALRDGGNETIASREPTITDLVEDETSGRLTS